MSDIPEEKPGEWRKALILLVLLFGGAALAWTYLGPGRGAPGGDAVAVATDGADQSLNAAGGSQAAQEAVEALEGRAEAPEGAAEDADVAALDPAATDGDGAQAELEDATPEAAALPEAPESPSTPQDPVSQAPTFDVVRVDPAGNALIAGRAKPGSKVRIELDGEEIEVAMPDATGNFVALFNVGQLEAPSAVALIETDEDGQTTTSEQVVVLSPPANPEPEISDEAPEAATALADVAAPEIADAPEATGALGVTQTGRASPGLGGGDPVTPSAPSVIVADSTGVRVVQGREEAPEVADNVVIDAITYDDGGEVVLSGRAPGESFVRIYVDNRPVEVGTVGADGQWRAELPSVDTGTYTLRVDQVDAEGAVLSRVETPFRREPAEAIRELAVGRAELEEKPLLELITVQPGNTLWEISNQAYGDGTFFVKLFEANAEKIRDPNLIYPGQVFSIPN